MRKQRRLTQDLKDSVVNDYSSIGRGEDLFRKINALDREINLISAPTLYLLPTLRILCLAIVKTSIDNYQSITGKNSPDKKPDSALMESLAFAYEQFSTWTRFWLGILFDWLLTEVMLILRRVAMLMAMVIGYGVGIFLVLASIYFLFTH